VYQKKKGPFDYEIIPKLIDNYRETSSWKYHQDMAEVGQMNLLKRRYVLYPFIFLYDITSKQCLPYKIAKITNVKLKF